ncbi:hypothetical protein RHAB21_02680 [Pseudorhizobium halotolerans]|jgi:hypothetical protein|uniref:Uncharacterized protein n=1 Tax=Pseudorhizobium halotolerans TaxID=1233081 RepID=A0ABM8PM95_9HYPH|nr:hypothetical protein RHAB21_02680 [Pseudorhizobium halotolerans]
MDMVLPASHRLPLVALIILVGVAVSGGAFYGWMRYGSDMLITLSENGLSGCL